MMGSASSAASSPPGPTPVARTTSTTEAASSSTVPSSVSKASPSSSPSAPAAVPSSSGMMRAVAAADSAASTSPTVRRGEEDPFVNTFGDLSYNASTQRLLAESGGPDGIIRITTLFYQKFHLDTHIRQFLGDVQTPLEDHARRIGMYISEMMGATGRPWTSDLSTRPRCPIRIQGGGGSAQGGKCHYAESRADAHYIAWHSVAREPSKVGRRFKLDDCRVWMRLFFWSAREANVSPALFTYLVRWIGHFIAIYESTARQFTRAEARWSANPANLSAYVEGGRYMADVVNVPLSVAQRTLPAAELGDPSGWLTRPVLPADVVY